MDGCGTMRRTTIRALILLGWGAGLSALPASDSAAQTLDIQPVADLSLPTRISLKDGTLHLQQKVGLKLGGRMTVTFNPRFDLVTAVTYNPGYATLQGGGKRFALSTSGHSLGAATGARYWLVPADRKFSCELHAGLGVVFAGPAYEALLDNSTVSAVIGSNLAYRVGRIAVLKLRVQERLLRLRFGSQGPGSNKSPFQVSFGLGLPFLELLRPL
jgi:hypothetical protein